MKATTLTLETISNEDNPKFHVQKHPAAHMHILRTRTGDRRFCNETNMYVLMFIAYSTLPSQTAREKK